MTDITDYLILEERIDYRSAHQVVGKVVADLVKENRSGKDIKLDDLIKAASDLEITITTLNDSKLAELVDFKNIVNSRKSLGGASSHSINAILSSNKTSTEEKKNTFLKKKEFMQISLQKLEKECKDF